MAAGVDPAGPAPAVHVEPVEDHPNTVYVIAVDQYGNVVSLIQSLFASFGFGAAAPRPSGAGGRVGAREQRIRRGGASTVGRGKDRSALVRNEFGAAAS